MKKEFEMPEFEVMKFNIQDVITESVTPGENETPNW